MGAAVAIPAIISGIGTGITAYGQHRASVAARRAGDANARATEEMTQYRLGQQQEIDQEIMGEARAAVGGSAVTPEGSPLAVEAENARRAELNLAAIRRGGELTAAAERRAGLDAARSARLQMYGTILGGALDIGSPLLRRRRSASLLGGGAASELGDWNAGTGGQA